MWQLWALTLAVPAIASLALYAVLRTAGSAEYTRSDHVRSAAIVFVLLLAATVWRNASENVAPDPYTDAQPRGYGAS